MKTLFVREERPEEFRRLEELVRDAFWDLHQPGCDEHFMLHKLRADQAFLPELSFVAEDSGIPVGGIYYSRALIRNRAGKELPVVTFGPLAVAPESQRQGVGSALVRHSIIKAGEAGHGAIMIFGDPGYYRRFGFRAGEEYGIADSGGEFCFALQALELRKGFLDDCAGRFYDSDVFRVDQEAVAGFDAAFPPRKKHALPSQMLLGSGTVRAVAENDFEDIYEIINDAATAYRGVIPADCLREPYMSREELRCQIDDGVVFYGYYVNGLPVGVMGIQDKGEVCLIRHAYVRSVCRKAGIGGRLLRYLHARATVPMLIGTWGAASWAIAFYRKNGFRLIEDVEHKNALLRRYWKIPVRQVETSVVLTDQEI